MRHLLVCPEFPPARGGGIGTWAGRIANLLANRHETVHVIAAACDAAPAGPEYRCGGRLVLHRLPHPLYSTWKVTRTLAPRATFAWRAAQLAERLIRLEHIDVIEAQEYDAPLFVLQLRRARGLGPRRRPPIIVHLHSPTHLIARHNGAAGPYARATMRREAFSIRAADAVIAPDYALARWAEAHYGLARRAITVIRYPLGPASPVPPAPPHSNDIWFVGRLERRKGVIEWVDAAVRAALHDDTVRFTFIGADTRTGEGGRSMRATLERRIPASVRARFTFTGPVPRDRIPALLRDASIVAVPSRWDNFPNVCMEAMAAGRPVLGTRTGGIAAMVTDGTTGWLAEPGSADALHDALRRALAASPGRRAAMGDRARREIAAMCDPDRIAEQHHAHRRTLVRRHSRSAVRLTVLPASTKTRLHAGDRSSTA